MAPRISKNYKILNGHGITLTSDQQNPCLLQSTSLWQHISNCITAINKTRTDFYIQRSDSMFLQTWEHMNYYKRNISTSIFPQIGSIPSKRLYKM